MSLSSLLCLEMLQDFISETALACIVSVLTVCFHYNNWPLGAIYKLGC
jgi:hypothetical protein